MANTAPNAFFAYPSRRPLLNESIREAVRKINVQGQIKIQTWEDYGNAGTLITNTICNTINEADLFFADVTGLNANVMFELGYAIARNKRIWLIFNKTLKDEEKMFNELKILSTIEYVDFSNSDNIVSGFYKSNPLRNIEDTIFRKVIQPNLKPRGYDSILHLKSKHEDEAAMRVSHSLGKRLSNRIIVDDPSESTIPPLDWYGTHVFGCAGLACHFANPDVEGAHVQTARHALVCGMAHGFNKLLLMLAEDKFLPPVDYRDYLKQYNTTRAALEHLQEWLPSVEKVLKDKQEVTEIQHAAQFATDLKNLRFGEPVAENEEEDLVEKYFIPTAAYDDAVNGRRTVFVGRKGAGKTANLIKLEDELGKNQQNLVCVIKPQRYQMLGMVDLLKQYQHRNVKGYAIESLWKFLLLTEIANAAFNNLINSPDGLANTEAQRFYSFVTKNEEIICEDFPTRLESCVQDLKDAVGASNGENTYLPVSEALHSGILKQLRVELGEYLSKKQRVAILVDNLDQAWEQHNEIEALSEILWGLLEVAKQLPGELEKQDSRRQSIQLSLAIFLRSDIFYRIREAAHEPDKMPYELLNWDNPESLCHIIEERFSSSFDPPLSSDVLWEEYFCPTVSGISTKEYITETILKRPRDIIFFVNAAVTTAINRGHKRIEEDDILGAEKQYSQHAFDSVNVENTLLDINLKDVIFGFVGMPAILTIPEVLESLQFAKVSDEMIEPTIDVLHDLTFLGLEVGEGRFIFSEVPEDSRKNKILAQRFAHKRGQEGRFQIHKAFRAFLEIEEI